MEYLIYPTVKFIHIISATLLFGTGLGSAFYMFMAYRSGNMKVSCHCRFYLHYTHRNHSISHWALFTGLFRADMDFNMEFIGARVICICWCMLVARSLATNLVT